MRISALTLVLLCALYSCSPRIYGTVGHSVTDTVIVTRVLCDTTIMVEKDSSLLRALVECDSIGNVRLAELIEYKAGEHVRVPELRLKNNELIVKAEVDSFNIAMSYMNTHTELRKKETLIQTEIIEVNKLNFLQRALMHCGALAVLGIIIYLLFKLKF